MASEVEQFLDKKDEEAIIEAIRTAESVTSGEIRVHLERGEVEDAFGRAKALFHELKMDNTKEENGVLIYVAVTAHKFAILGDRGINRVVPPDFWESTKEIMQSHFKQSKFKDGLVAGITKAGEKLAQYFPWQDNDVNELPDDISTS